MVIEQSVPIENFPNVLNYICSDHNRLITLTKYPKDELTKVFGKHDGRCNNGEFNYYVWVINYKDNRYNLFTDRIKGLCVEIIGEDINNKRYKENKSVEIKEFLNYLVEKLK